MQKIQSDFNFFFSSLSYCGYDVEVAPDGTMFKINTHQGEVWFHFDDKKNIEFIEFFPDTLDLETSSLF